MDTRERLRTIEKTQSRLAAEAEFMRGRIPEPRGYDVACNQAQAVRERTPEEIISDLFTYHPANEAQAVKYETVRDAAKHLALVIWKACPYGSDRTTAIRKLREAVMTANAAIALDGRSL